MMRRVLTLHRNPFDLVVVVAIGLTTLTILARAELRSLADLPLSGPLPIRPGRPYRRPGRRRGSMAQTYQLVRARL